MMRICFVSRRFFPAISGMSVYAVNLLRELVQAGHDVTMISQYRGDEEGKRIYGGGPPPSVPGVKVLGLEAKGEQESGDFERDIAEMVSTIMDRHHQQPFDLLHAQYAYPTGLAALEAGKHLRIPTVVSIQGGDGHWVGLCCGTHKSAMLAVLDHADALLIGSRSFADEVSHNHGTSPKRFTIVPGAVDIGRFHPVDNWHPGMFLNQSRPSILYHGRVDVRKGVLDLLDAFAEVLRDSSVKPRLVISGIGPDVGAAEQRIQQLSLSNHVEMPGYVAYENVPQLYREHDIFVSPTYAEGFSNTLLEAMASGLPVISTRCVGVVDFLRQEETGLLIEPGDTTALKRAILRLLHGEALREKLARCALNDVLSEYSWPHVSQLIMNTYEKLQGTTSDTSWTLNTTIDPCRFRLQPHLL